MLGEIVSFDLLEAAAVALASQNSIEKPGKIRMKEQSYLTIAIPFYSKLAFLKAAVESVLRQDCPNWRLMIVDDCSAEQTVKEYASSLKDDRISYFRNEKNLGLAGNWNRCLDLAESDLVTLLHSDDVVEPGYVRTFLQAARESPDAAAFFCPATIIDQHGIPTKTVADAVKDFLTPKQHEPLSLSGEPAIAALLRGNFIVCPTLCYRKSVLESHRFQPSLKMVLDFEFTLRLLVSGHTLIGIQQKLYRYRRHDSNLTNELSRDLVRSAEECWLWNHLIPCLEDIGWRQAARVAKKKTIVKLTLGYLIFDDILKLRPRAAWNKLVFLPTLWSVPQQELLGE